MQLSDHTQHGLQSLTTTLKVKRATLQTIIISVHITSSKHLRYVICIEVIAYLQIFLKVQKTLAITILELFKGGGESYQSTNQFLHLYKGCHIACVCTHRVKWGTKWKPWLLVCKLCVSDEFETKNSSIWPFLGANTNIMKMHLISLHFPRKHQHPYFQNKIGRLLSKNLAAWSLFIICIFSSRVSTS